MKYSKWSQKCRAQRVQSDVPLHVLQEGLYGGESWQQVCPTERSVSACLTNNSRRDMLVILPSWEDASIFHAVLASLRESPTVAGKVTMAGLFL